MNRTNWAVTAVLLVTVASPVFSADAADSCEGKLQGAVIGDFAKKTGVDQGELRMIYAATRTTYGMQDSLIFSEQVVGFGKFVATYAVEGKQIGTSDDCSVVKLDVRVHMGFGAKMRLLRENEIIESRLGAVQSSWSCVAMCAFPLPQGSHFPTLVGEGATGAEAFRELQRSCEQVSGGRGNLFVEVLTPNGLVAVSANLQNSCVKN